LVFLPYSNLAKPLEKVFPGDKGSTCGGCGKVSVFAYPTQNDLRLF
jgi:hypothetical protein